MVGFVPVPGFGVDGGDDPVRGDLPRDAQHPAGARLQVLAQHRGEELCRLHDRFGQVLEPVEGSEEGVAVPGAGVDQGLPGRFVGPVDDRLG
jgi:hypothetical protein